MRFGPSQLSCLGSSVGRALCLEYRVSWVRVPPEAVEKTALGVLCCFALFVCLTLLASFFLPSHLSFKNMYIQKKLPVSVLFRFLFRSVPFRSVFHPVFSVPFRSVHFRSVHFRSNRFPPAPGQTVLALGMNSSAKFTACVGGALRDYFRSRGGFFLPCGRAISRSSLLGCVRGLEETGALALTCIFYASLSNVLHL